MAVTPVKLMAALNDPGAVRQVFDIQMFLPGEVVTVGFIDKKRYLVIEHLETCPGTFRALPVPEGFNPDMDGAPIVHEPVLIFDPASRRSVTQMLRAMTFDGKATMEAISKRFDAMCREKGLDPNGLMAMMR